MSKAAAVAVPSIDSVAAIFNLADPNERRIFDTLQEFYSSQGQDRLRAIRRGTIPGPNGLVRMLWTLGSFHPLGNGQRVEWIVTYWHIDEVAVRFQRCPDETTARTVYTNATHPDASLPGLGMKAR